MSVNETIQSRTLPEPAAVLELMKPITWFAPMWAFACGVLSSGEPVAGRLGLVFAGVLLAGPLVCAMSQAANDWYDRHVDAINEPDRPIPSGRVPGRWGLRIALFWTVLSLGVALALGPWVAGAAVLAIATAWAYSAPPIRLKRNGWLSCGACGLAYETLPWITGAALLSVGAPAPQVLAVAVLYGIGAHGIMVLNDFKAVEGDRALGLATLPVTLGVDRAARIACWTMAVPQALVVVVLLADGGRVAPLVVALLLAAQVRLMPRLLADPAGKAPWYNAAGTGLYVLGMMVSALALGAHLWEVI